jgi:long-subunit fatty acid transport protein
MYSQIHEVGVFLGGSNYIGDIGPTTYISPNEPAFGILYKYNKSPRHAYRFSYTQSKITSNDLDSKEPSRSQRGYRFENNIKEVSLGLEFNFFDFNLHELDRQFTPYIYSGISYTQYNGLFFVDGKTRSDANHGTIAIPMTVGIKTNLNNRFILGLEVGARYTFADDIDGSNPTNKNLEQLKFGNINNNDWYVFSGLTLTYTFGEKPCYCAE